MKKLLGAFMVSCVAVLMPFVLTACGQSPQVMHKPTWVWDSTVEPTCSSQGYEIWIDADNPAAVWKRNYTPINHENHQWGTGIVVLPNCLKGDTDGDGHTDGDGYTEYTCEHNHAHKYRDTYVTLEQYKVAYPLYDGHNWVAKETVLPNCLTVDEDGDGHPDGDGYTLYECSIDHSTKKDNWVTLAAYQTAHPEKDDDGDFIYDGHDWVVKEVVLPNCITIDEDEDGRPDGIGYTLYQCSLDKTTKKGNWVTLADFQIEYPEYDGHEWEAVETIAPTCSTRGYTVYECQLDRSRKDDDFVDPDPDVHNMSGFLLHSAATGDKPEVQRDTCLYSTDTSAKYYVEGSPVHYSSKYITTALQMDGNISLELTNENGVQWFNLPVAATDTFVKLEFTGAGEITLYEFNAAAADTVFTQAQETEFANAVSAVGGISPAGIQYITVRANRVYFIKVTNAAATAGVLSAVKIMEEDIAMLSNLYASGVTAISNVSPGTKTYSFTDIIKVKDRNGDEIIVSHSKDDWNDNITRTREQVMWADKYVYTKIYGFNDGENIDIFTFAIAGRVAEVNEDKYKSLMSIIGIVLGGFGLNADNCDNYYVWAFIESGTAVSGYYGVEEVVIIPENVTAISYNSSSPTYAFKDNLLIKEVIFQGNALNSIGGNTFSGCRNLERIVLPSSVTSIGNNAFNDCGSLKFVYYKGAYPLEGIAIGEIGNTALTDNIIYFSEDTPTPVGNEKYWHYADGVLTIWNVAQYTHTVSFRSANASVGTAYTAEFGSVLPGTVLTEYKDMLPAIANTEFQYWYYILETGGKAYEIQYDGQRIAKDTILYAKYKSPYFDGLFTVISGEAAPVTGLYPAVNRYQYSADSDGITLQYYLYFDEAECEAEYYTMLQSLYTGSLPIAAHRFGAEIFIAYGSDEAEVSAYMTDLLAEHKSGVPPTESYTSANGYPLPPSFGDIGQYVDKLVAAGWNPTITTGNTYLPSNMASSPHAVVFSGSIRLLIVEIDTGNEAQLMKDLLAHNLDAMSVMYYNDGHLFMLVDTPTDVMSPNDLANILGITWNSIIDKMSALEFATYSAVKSIGYYDTPTGYGIESGLKLHATFNTLNAADMEMMGFDLALVHSMEFYIYDTAANAIGAMAGLSAGENVSAVYKKGNIVLVYKNVASKAELDMLIDTGITDTGVDGMSIPSMKEVICGEGGDWDDSVIKLT
jgi:hypothetical protein